MRILKKFCIACVRFYQLVFAPLFFSFGVRCRFSPSCSHYAVQAIEAHGVIKGTGLALLRLGRCHPLGTSGYDPVPTRAGMEIKNG